MEDRWLIEYSGRFRVRKRLGSQEWDVVKLKSGSPLIFQSACLPSFLQYLIPSTSLPFPPAQSPSLPLLPTVAPATVVLVVRVLAARLRVAVPILAVVLPSTPIVARALQHGDGQTRAHFRATRSSDAWIRYQKQQLTSGPTKGRKERKEKETEGEKQEKTKNRDRGR